MTINRFKQSQKFRVIVGDACFYATAKQIRNGVGDFYKCNAATQKALDALEFSRVEEHWVVGICGSWEGLQIQLNVA